MHTGRETACCVIFNIRDRYEQQSQKVATCKKKSALVRWEQTRRLFIAALLDSALDPCKGSMYSSKTDLKTVRGFRDNRAAKNKVLFSQSPQSLKMNTLCIRVSVKNVAKQLSLHLISMYTEGSCSRDFSAPVPPAGISVTQTAGTAGTRLWSRPVTLAAWGLRQEDGKFGCCLENLDPVSKPEVTGGEQGLVFSSKGHKKKKKKKENETKPTWHGLC